jgi:hypothetical protein
MFPALRNGSRLPAIALQSSDFITVIRKPSAPFRQPSRDVGFPSRKIEEPDYCMISVWEKCVTSVTLFPEFIGNDMSKLTGSAAPIDHELTARIRVASGAGCRAGRAVQPDGGKQPAIDAGSDRHRGAAA